MAFLSGWNYRKPITVDASNIDASLSDFPVLVKLSNSNFDFSKALSSGNDIRFTLADGSTLLKYEREIHNDVAEKAVYHVKVPNVDNSTDTIIYMYYGNALAGDGADAENVWDANFVAVYHMKNDTSSTILDSTSNNYDGTKSASNQPLEVDGLNGKAQDFERNNNQQINIGDLNFDGAFTIEGLLNPESLAISPSYYNNYLTGKFNSAGNNSQANVTCLFNENGHPYIIIGDTVDSQAYNPSTPAISVGSYQYVAFKGDNSDIVIWIDDSFATTTQTVIPADNSNSRDIGQAGDFNGANSPFDGIIDEVRFSDVARSDAWLKATRLTLSDSLLVVGSEEQDTIVEESEEFLLSDQAQVSANIDSSLSDEFIITDEITVLPAVTVDKSDQINLNDEIITSREVERVLNLTEDIILSESAGINVDIIKLNEEESILLSEETIVDHFEIDEIDSLELSDEISATTIGGIAKYASKILSIDSNTLAIVTNSSPLRIVKIDKTTPDSPSYEIFTYPTVSYGVDAVYNDVFGYLYICCSEGKVLQIDVSNFNSSAILNSGDLDDFISLAQLEDFHLLLAGTDEVTGEIISIDNSTYKSLDMDIQCLQSYTDFLNLDCRITEGKTLYTDIQCLQEYKPTLNLDVRVIADAFDEIAESPIEQTDWVVKIDGVTVDDVELNSIEIYHVIDSEKSRASFRLRRHHDNLNTMISGSNSPILSKNTVNIYINDILEFTGKVSTVSSFSETESVEIIAKGYRPSDNRKKVTVPLASINEKLHPYHCLINNPVIENPYISSDEDNPDYYLGIEVDLGSEVIQNISRWKYLSDVSDNVLDGTFQPKQNWTYFWFARAYNYFTGRGQFTARYVGTSPASLTSDIWELNDLYYRYQRQFEDKENSLGTHQIGQAPYKSISVRNGIKKTKSKWVDFPDGLYRQKDEGYNFLQYAKTVAQLEYNKMKNINGDILPKTSADIELMLDGYYYYGIKLLTRINIDNTISSSIFKDANGFPVSVKSIQLSSSSMRAVLKCDNSLSNLELEEIDDQYPDPESDEYVFPEQAVKENSKFDYSRYESVE